MTEDDVRRIAREEIAKHDAAIVAELQTTAEVISPPLYEQGTRWVKCSPEIVRQLSDEWSRPVQIMITADDGHTLELTMRTVEGSPSAPAFAGHPSSRVPDRDDR